MPTAGRATLAVLGAGPKGIAIAAKRAALARTGRDVPDLLVIDREGVAANWSGAAGYTDGHQRLSTPPEKDVGFPYAHTWGADSELVSHQIGRWSWQRYLVHQDGFADWVDRGRPRPTHRQWSQYLRWVASQVPVEPLLAEVDGIDLAGGRWRLAARTPTGERLDVDCDGLVLTGPGPPMRLPGQPDDHPRILDGRSFWTSQDALGRGGPVEVCVVGNGETAGSVATVLLGLLPEGSTIELVSDHGVLYTRGEGFTENRFYSDPAVGWQRLAERHRREFLKRTDRGVFSVQVEDVLNRAEAVRTVAGRVVGLEPVEGKVVVEVDYEQERERVAFDWVVVAVGFDPLWFGHLLGERARAALVDAVGGGPAGRLPSRTLLERAIGHDLAITGLDPRLHLPVLAGVAQGPGFPNLSCLGLLADRVLATYTAPMRDMRVPAPDAAARGTARQR
ncbi:MAG TPA: SidA/IucD/PvdA family monooxygenase [Actinomycetes bacterium]